MGKRIPKKIAKINASIGACDFSDYLPFCRYSFADGPDSLPYYSIDCTVSQLASYFQIFEEQKNIELWPVRSIIQRELNNDRARKDICDGYLRQEGIKFFPPLIAVLLPTGDDHMPLDTFQSSIETEKKAASEKVYLPAKDLFDEYQSKLLTECRGVYEIAESTTSDTGFVFWDKNAVSAIIIDGQHRFRALKLAADADKKFLNWRVPLILIDLPKTCKQIKKKPTEVVRDLFVKINSTPEEVDDARLILMNDREAISTFVQLLVDDSGKDLPAVEPELLDWHCQGGKHQQDESLTGVLTLYHVVRACITEGISLDSIEERSSPRGVAKWVQALNTWLDVDKVIKEKLGNSETLSMRAKPLIATCDTSSSDLGEEEGESDSVLFSYSQAASRIIQEEFGKILLPVFRACYTELAPYREFRKISDAHGPLTKGREIKNYFRKTNSARKEALKTQPALKAELAAFKVDIKKLVLPGGEGAMNVLFTVMGQKSLIKAVFNAVAKIDGSLDDENAIGEAVKFIKQFNVAYEKLMPSKNAKECFFHSNFSPKAETKLIGLEKEFWSGIVLKNSGELDYSGGAVKLLTSIIEDITKFANKPSSKFTFSKRSEIARRHERVLTALETKGSIEAKAEAIIVSKENSISKIFGKVKKE